MTVTPTPAPGEKSTGEQPTRLRTRAYRLFREITAILFWVYAISKVFIFDIDVYITSQVNPSLLWILQYKVLFFLAAIALIAAFVNTYIALWFAVYVLIYPLIFLFWKVPFFIYKQKSWLLLFQLINFVGSFVRAFRARVISLAVFIISFVICIESNLSLLLYAASVAILFILILTFVRVFLDLARPNSLFEFYKKCFSWVSTSWPSTIQNRDQIKGLQLTSMNESQLTIYRDYLGSTVTASRLLLFTAKKLREYQRSSIGILGGIGVFFFLWLYTLTCFAAINQAVFTIDSSGFSTKGAISLFVFFRYSFYTYVYSGIGELVAISPLTQGIAMLEAFFAFVTVTLFAGAMIVTIGERYSTQLDDLIVNAEREGRRAEGVIRDELGLSSVEAAITELDRLKYSLLSAILYMTRNLD